MSIRRSQLTSQASGQYDYRIQAWRPGAKSKEVNMLLQMLQKYKETKSISEAADICEYLLELYEQEMGAANEEPA